MACAIPWHPSVLAPVFFGHKDLSTASGLPTAVRVFYPSVDGAPEGAPFLADCGRYPLVLFLHGQCHDRVVNRTEVDHYLRWFEFPAVLARCGYVVVVPDFQGTTNPFEDAHLSQAQAVLAWMRDEWDLRAHLADQTAVAGHSFGGVLAGRLAATGIASAYISLSGEWNEVVPGPLNVLRVLGAPALFAWGTEQDPEKSPDLDAQLEAALLPLWNLVKPPKHRLRFIDGRHFDYLRPGQSACASGGPCSLVGSVAADVAALFLSRYLPPPDAGLPRESVDVSLTPPPLSLTPEQEFFVGGHLGGLEALPRHPACTVTLDEGPPVRIIVEPSSIKFGAVPINSVRNKTLTIRSTGEGHVTLSIPPPSPGAVLRWDAVSTELGPNGSLEVRVRFQPKTTAIESATIRVTSNAAGSPHLVKLGGKGAGGLPIPGGP